MIPTIAYEHIYNQKYIDEWKKCIKKNKNKIEVCRPIYEKYLRTLNNNIYPFPYDPSQEGYPPKNL